jgi:hypothetical protein
VALKVLYEPCEFENERLLTFVDNPDFDPKDGGYLDGGKLIYKPELVEQPLSLAQHAERLEQQLTLLSSINVLILRRRIGAVGSKFDKDTDPSSSMWRVVNTLRPLPPGCGVLLGRAQPSMHSQNAQGWERCQ